MINGNASGIGVFCSTVENSSRKFDTLFEQYSGNSTQNKFSVPGLTELLAGKYEITREPGDKKIVDTVKGENATFYITEKKACPIGFAVDYILTEDEFMMISQEQKALVLMQAAIIDESELNKLENVASSIRKSDFDYEENIDSLVDKTISNKVLEFHKDSHGFTCTTFYDKNRLIYFTVPWSEGWKVSIDGKETKLINSGGMMALIVPEGKHQVEFVYHTPGFFIGIITSLVSCFIFIIYVMYNIKTVRAEKSA